MLGCLFLGILQYRVSYDRDCKGSDLSKHKKIDPFALKCNCVWNHFRYCCFSEHPSIHFLSPLTRHHAVLVWRRHYTLNKSAVFHTAITIINTWFRKSAGKHIPCCQWRPNSRLKRKKQHNGTNLLYNYTSTTEIWEIQRCSLRHLPKLQNDVSDNTAAVFCNQIMTHGSFN